MNLFATALVVLVIMNIANVMNFAVISNVSGHACKAQKV